MVWFGGRICRWAAILGVNLPAPEKDDLLAFLLTL